MKIACSHIEESLSAATREELAACVEVQEHLAECQSCAQLAEALWEVDSYMAAPDEAQVPPELLETTLQAVRENHRDTKRHLDARVETNSAPVGRRFGVVAGGSLFAAAAGVLFVLTRQLGGGGNTELAYREELATPTEYRDGKMAPPTDPSSALEPTVNAPIGSTKLQGQPPATGIRLAEAELDLDDLEGEYKADKTGKGAGIIGGLTVESGGYRPVAKLPALGDSFDSSLAAQAGEYEKQGAKQGLSFSGSTSLENSYEVDGRDIPLEDLRVAKIDGELSEQESSRKRARDWGRISTETGTRELWGSAGEIAARGAFKQSELRNSANEEVDEDTPADAVAFLPWQTTVAAKPKPMEKNLREEVASKAEAKATGEYAKRQVIDLATLSTEELSGTDSSKVDPNSQRAQVGGEESKGPSISSLSGKKGKESQEAAMGKRDSQRHSLASQILRERNQIEGVTTTTADGYWENPFKVSSAYLKLMDARLGHVPEFSALRDLRSPYQQQLDTPRNSAVGLSVHSDRAYVDGRSRVLMQVGISGTEKRAQRRSERNVVLVVDLGNFPKESRTAMSQTLLSFARAKRPGDHFSLVVANGPKLIEVSSKEFRHGSTKVALRSMFTEASEGSGQSLEACLTRAAELLAENHDSSSPIGRSMMVYLSGSSVSADQLQAASERAHQAVLGGFTMHTLGVGAKADAESLAVLAARGQGSFDEVSDAKEAEAKVQKQLLASDRVVARSLKLRVNLAKGAKLVGVVGSQKLSEVQVSRSRAEEKSLDLQTQAIRGIVANRQDDEDGIKILIPNLSAGEKKVILLDLIVDGPGPIAEVSAQYKDLVFARNGVGQVAVKREARVRREGSSERNVLRNYFAWMVSERLRKTATTLRNGDLEGARREAGELQAYMQALPVAYSWLRDDRQFAGESRAIESLTGALRRGLRTDNHIAYADLFHMSSWRKHLLQP